MSIAPDVIVLGSGIAGASIAAHLAPCCKVTLIETEEISGYHTTGRSAAMFIPSYGTDTTRPLTRASRAFLQAPPPGFGGSLLRRRAAMHVARSNQLAALSDLAQRVEDPVRLSAAEAVEHVPILRRGGIEGAVLEPDAGDIDVGRLHAGWLRQAREHGAEIRLGVGGYAIERRQTGWRLGGSDWTMHAPVLVNATGAWADATAMAAGLGPKRLEALRRTVVLVEAPPHDGFQDWPIVKDVGERFYFRPFAGRLLITPADEKKSPPCDAQPEPLDIAIAMMRFHDVADHDVHAIRHKWAGLRTFAPDRSPIIGWSEEAPGFFWFAGLGGIGIQTAPASARLAAALLLGAAPPTDLVDQGLQVSALHPARFARAA